MLLNLIIFSIVLIFGIVCVKYPMVIIRFEIWWIKKFIGKNLGASYVNDKLRQIIILYDNDPKKYQITHLRQIQIIQFSGYFACIWVTLASCSLFSAR